MVSDKGALKRLWQHRHWPIRPRIGRVQTCLLQTRCDLFIFIYLQV